MSAAGSLSALVRRRAAAATAAASSSSYLGVSSGCVPPPSASSWRQRSSQRRRREWGHDLGALGRRCSTTVAGSNDPRSSAPPEVRDRCRPPPLPISSSCSSFAPVLPASAFPSTPRPRSFPLRVRHFSSSSPSPSDEKLGTVAAERRQKGKLRVAVVGGGAAGLSAALHLAPLASAGIIASPVDVYETTPDPGDGGDGTHSFSGSGDGRDGDGEDSFSESESGPGSSWSGYFHPDSDPAGRSPRDENFHYGTGAAGRSIGVGVWSTALLPWASSGRPSHEKLLKALERAGRYVGAVGYRIPNGKWLAKSKLNTSRCSSGCSGGRDESDEESDEEGMDVSESFDEVPGLLFLREKDLLRALREACREEEADHGTIRLHYAPTSSEGGRAGSTTVTGIHLPRDRSECPSSSYGLSGRLEFADGSVSPDDRPYHLIVAAGGMGSAMRLRYGGRSVKQMQTAVAHGGGSPKPTYGISGARGLSDGGMESAYYGSGTAPGGIRREQLSEWAQEATAESHAIEDRGYTVFRGNAKIQDEDVEMGGGAFQTWGEGEAMRFAAVQMSYPSTDWNDRNVCGRAKRQVWFATTNDRSIAAVKNPKKRKERLKEAFSAWHNPVTQLIEGTPADSILMERGVSHKCSVRPVLNLAEVIDYEHKMQCRKALAGGTSGDDDGGGGNAVPASMAGPGPAVVFVGDAVMTVDPVLAQGFTFAMESTADLAQTLRRCCGSGMGAQIPAAATDDADSESPPEACSLKFNPDRLRDELDFRYHRRYDRLLGLLRSTELVQALAQPESGTVSGFLSRNFVRPMMRLAPEIVKRRVFNYMIRYSLGLTLKTG